MSDDVKDQGKNETPVQNSAEGVSLEQIAALIEKNNTQLLATFSEMMTKSAPKAQGKVKSDEPNPYQAELSARVKAEMEILSESEQTFVSEFGGDDPIQQSRALLALANLKKNGAVSGGKPEEKKPEEKKPEEKKPEGENGSPEPPETAGSDPGVIVEKPVRLDLSGSASKAKPESWGQAAQMTIQQLQSRSR